MKDDEKFAFFVGGVIGVLLALALFLFLNDVSNSTYRDGQIDALSGKAYYQLIEREDMSRDWRSTVEPYKVQCYTVKNISEREKTW